MTATTKTGEASRRRDGSGSVAEVLPRHWSLRVYDPATRRQVYRSFVGGSREANQALANFAADVRAGKSKPVRAEKTEAKAQAQRAVRAALGRRRLGHSQPAGCSQRVGAGRQEGLKTTKSAWCGRSLWTISP